MDAHPDRTAAADAAAADSAANGRDGEAAGAAGVRLSESAARRVAEIARGKGRPGLKLRLAVDGGGCSGFTYRFSLEETVAPDDLVAETDGVSLVVDPTSLPLLEGAEVDYVEKLGAAAFEVRNPNAASGCGCGSSFSI